MAKLVAIVGPSGTGKSKSIEELNPEETFIINVAKGKPLPFKGSAKLYNKEKKNFMPTDRWNDVIGTIRNLSEKAPHVKTLVIDDAGWIMSTEFFERAQERGFDKFNEIGQHMFYVFKEAESAREDMNIVFIFHEEILSDDTITVVSDKRKIKTIGKLIDDKYTPEGAFTVLLYTHVDYDGEGNPKDYCFITNRTNQYPAKSPPEMFDNIKIPNNLQFVIQKMNEYYGE